MIDLRINKVSIRTRILTLVLLLVIFIFAVILSIFNLLLAEYIKSSIIEQFKDVIMTTSREHYLERIPSLDVFSHGQRRGLIPEEKVFRKGFLESDDVLILTQDYEIVFPSESMYFLQNYEAMRDLAIVLKNEQADLKNSQIMQTRANDREYSFVSIPMRKDRAGENYYFIYSIDMTAARSFANRLNYVLLVVMGLAGALAVIMAVFLSGEIAKPIRELTRFATRIGNGNFLKSVIKYGDKELSELADSMNKAASQLDAYDREQKMFFQNVSHELRTPLQAIKCNAEGIECGILDHRKSSGIIIKETDRLTEMVEDLLYLSQMDNITSSSQYEDCDLREILSNCAERQKSLAAEQKVQYVFEFDSSPVSMRCYEKHMFRAFFNLISNAIRYAKTTITLACHNTINGIIISVADDGDGISKEDIPQIFNRFYKGKDGNYGIGLSIVKTIIEQHEGGITVQSCSKGTVFKITF